MISMAKKLKRPSPIRIPSPSDDVRDTGSLLEWAIRKRLRKKSMVLNMDGLNLGEPTHYSSSLAFFIPLSDESSVGQCRSRVEPNERYDESHRDGDTRVVESVQNVPSKRVTVHTEHAMDAKEENA
jgi:hypothetical protein